MTEFQVGDYVVYRRDVAVSGAGAPSGSPCVFRVEQNQDWLGELLLKPTCCACLGWSNTRDLLACGWAADPKHLVLVCRP